MEKFTSKLFHVYFLSEVLVFLWLLASWLGEGGHHNLFYVIVTSKCPLYQFIKSIGHTESLLCYEFLTFLLLSSLLVKGSCD